MTAPRGLHTLAGLHGVQRSYHDNDGRRVHASPEALMGALRALGVPLDDPAGIPERVEHRRRTLWDRAVEPVVVVWTGSWTGGPGSAAVPGGDHPRGAASGGARGARGSFLLRTPARLRDRAIGVVIGLEEGGERTSQVEPRTLEVLRTAEVGGTEYVERAIPLPHVPPGYHDLVVEVGGGRETRRHRAVLIAAPERAMGWRALPGVAPTPDGDRGRGRGDGSGAWGLFAPLYALHEGNGDPATPDYPLLGRFADRAADAGASVIGTLPLLAAFLDDPYEPSPYAPVSRLFWNELYVAPEGGTGAAGAGTAGATGELLDPRAAMAARRPALESEARRFFGGNGPEPEGGVGAMGSVGAGESGGSEGSGGPPPSGDAAGTGPVGSATLGGPAELAAFRARNPLADDYARFRALTEARGPWGGWPDRLRARDVRPADYDVEAARYHLYVQYRAERQLAEVAERGASRGVSLYLDLPMGVHSQGYDVWRERSLFATAASAGAPPDPLGPSGQDWGFPPLHPERSRLDGHRYVVASIRKHLRFARVLRVDHVMQLHRMFWVTTGDARDGVYVKYPAEELYAILCLESHRAGAVIVGEDLGTVPRKVRRSMRRRGLPGMYVLEFELEEVATGDENADPALVPKRVPTGALASIGTHDTPTFAGWWWGEDIRIRREAGELTGEEAEAERAGRALMRTKLVRGVLKDFDFDFDFDRSRLGDESRDRGGDRADAESVEVAYRVQEALLRGMGESDAGLVLATVEDLWLEREPQNVPGTMSERNWRRRSRRGLEALSDARVAGLLDALSESREGSQ